MIDFNDYAVGQHRLQCPSCGRGGRDKTAGLKIDLDGSGVLNCFRCSYTESYMPDRGAAVRRAPTIKPKAQVQQHHGLNDWGMALWQSTQDLSGVAAQYLRARHCVVPPYGDLRWLPALKHPSGHVGPALVALITDVETNQPLSLHRTWITSTGKADIENPRLLLGNHSIVGGVIRLTPDDEVASVLGIAEGIETALSLAHAPLPVWATIDAGHLSAFPALRGISTLVIAVDNDPAGIAAATACADRWTDAGKTVLLTAQPENDLNDSLKEVSIEH
jgi:putative DNA primase/helicase